MPGKGRRKGKGQAPEAHSHGSSGACAGGHSHEGGGGHQHGSSGPRPSGKGTTDFGEGSYTLGRLQYDDMEDDMAEAVHYIDVIRHFKLYSQHALARLHVSRHHWETVSPLFQTLVPGLDLKYRALSDAVKTNQAFIDRIVAIRDSFTVEGIDYAAIEAKAKPIAEERMGKVRSTLRQFARDWSEEGAAERDQCYGAIIKEIEALYPLPAGFSAGASDGGAASAAAAGGAESAAAAAGAGAGAGAGVATSLDAPANRRDVRILVPGCGLGRLTWELAARGFEAEGNEFSYYMLLGSCLMLN